MQKTSETIRSIQWKKRKEYRTGTIIQLVCLVHDLAAFSRAPWIYVTNASNAVSISGVHELSGIFRSIPSDAKTAEGGVALRDAATNGCGIACADGADKPCIPICPRRWNNSGVKFTGIPAGGKNYIITSLFPDIHQNIPAPKLPWSPNEMELPSPFPSDTNQHDCRECSQRYTPMVAFCVSVFPLRIEDPK